MESASWKATSPGGTGDRPRPSPAEEVLEARRGDATIRCSPACDRSLRVLVADDNQDAADTLAMLVRLWGHEVRVAYDGVAALEMASAYQPDVFLLDTAMPGIDGYDLARQIRRQPRFEGALLVAITGYADEAHRLLGGAAGFDFYLAKPVVPSTVEILLRLERDRLAGSSEKPLVLPRKYAIAAVDDEVQLVTMLPGRPEETAGTAGGND